MDKTIRVLLFCLSAVVFSTEAFARLLERDTRQRVSLADLLDIRNSRYVDGRPYSCFPKAEKRLRISIPPRFDPLRRLYPAGQAFIYTVRPSDSLRKIARQHGMTVESIKERNRLTSDRLKPGQRISLWDQPLTIEVDKTFNRLYVMSGAELIREYPVSTGRASTQTPPGIFIIQSRYPYPVWFHKGVIVPGGSPDNFLGSRWLGFDKPQFGIHGTIFPELIGQSASKGCIRMKNEDIDELYEFIPAGTMVVITDR